MGPARRSAGILLVRRMAAVECAGEGAVAPFEFLLVHPGGPFWANKDLGAWSIPKGEHGDDEDPLECARREFAEELGTPCPAAELTELGEITQTAGKRVAAWCGVGDLDTSTIESNTFEMEWPPRSGRLQRFPEVDRAGWFGYDDAMLRVLSGQRPLIERAVRALPR